MGDDRDLARAAEAFVDRTTIDWAALSSRVGAAERAWVENLRRLAAARDLRGRRAERHAKDAQPRIGASIAIALAAFAIVSAIATILSAAARGESLAGGVPQLMLAAAYVCGSVPLVRARARIPGAQFLLATFLSSAAAFAASAAQALVPVAPDPLRGLPIEALTPACLWQFAVTFPHVTRFATFDLAARKAAAAAWLAGALLIVVNVIAEHGSIDVGFLGVLRRDDPGHAYWLLFAVALLPAVATIFVRARRASVDERRKVTRFAAALAGGSAPFLLSGIAWTLWPRLSDWLHSALHLDWLIVASLTTAPVLSSLAVVGDGSGLMAGAPAWARALARRAARSTDATPDERLARVLERLRVARSVREAAKVLARELTVAGGSTGARVLAAQRDRTFVDVFDSTVTLAPQALIATLAESSSPIDLSPHEPLLDLLPRQERDWARRHGAGLVAPMRRRDGTVVAIVVVSSKPGGAAFDARERRLVASLTTAAAVSWRDDWSGSQDDDTNASATMVAGARATGDADLAFECGDCGRVFESAVPPCGCHGPARLAALPRRLAAFTIVRRLGAGGMGVVYFARDEALDRTVALKTLPPLGAGAATRFRREARAMAAMGHDAVATIYGLETWRQTPVLVVEYFAGGTLADRIGRGPLSAAETVRIGLRLAHALAYLHANGMLHRDVKPSNIAVTASGAWKLLDFGVATLARDDAGDSLDRERACWAGTPAYMPPEAWRSGASQTAAADLWALGVTLLEAVTGANPLASRDRRSIARAARSFDVRQMRSDELDRQPALRSFFERALARRPIDRFADGAEMLAALEALSAAVKTSDGR